MSEKHGHSKQSNSAARYILITQCLQNDFFSNRECKLRLPISEVKKMLIGKEGPEPKEVRGSNRLQLASGFPDKGPLGLFFDSVIGRRLRGEDGRGNLYVINIRDCHKPEASYDRERRQYGEHCQTGTWGSDYIEGLVKYLDPDRKSDTPSPDGHDFKGNSVRVYQVQSDSVFDFKPLFKIQSSQPDRGKFPDSSLERILDDILLTPSDTAPPSEPGEASDDPKSEANRIKQAGVRSYIAVIGVYTDVKVKTLLMGLRSRYDIPNLAVSDTLTASPTLERHLGALDFAQKVLNVEVIHGLNNLIRFLGGSGNISNELDVVAADRFSDYASYFQDKQNVLAYEATKLREYMRLTQERAEKTYRTIKWANNALISGGIFFLLITGIGAVLSAFGWPDKLDWRLPLVTGGLSLLQLTSAFFWRPMADLQRNLTNLAAFRMILESHSLKMALARFHLTTPQTLHDDIGTDIKSDAVKKQVEALVEQIEAIEKIEEQDYKALKELGFGAEATAQKMLEEASSNSSHRGKKGTV